MNITQVGGRLRAQIHDFSGKLSPRFPKPTRRFIEQMIYGMLVTQDVNLSKISRSLGEDISYKKTVNRLSVNLNYEGMAQELVQEISRVGASRVREGTLLIIDPTDLSKQHAKKMEYLATVRDGSTGELGPGYWMLNVLAGKAGGRKFVPLYQSLYSADAPQYVSENAEIFAAVDTIRLSSGNLGTWVGDRGLDRGRIFDGLLERKARFVIRLKANRTLKFRGHPRQVLDLARGCPLWYRERIVKEGKEGEKSYLLQFGFRAVKLPGRPDELSLVVVTGFGEEPLMLLTNLQVRKSRRSLWTIVQSYLTRWLVEEAIRFTKQSFNLEDVRVLTYQRLCNMIALVLAASYFLAVHLGESLRLSILTRKILKASKRLYGISSFHYYALADGISYILGRVRAGIWCPGAAPIPDRQLTLSGLF